MFLQADLPEWFTPYLFGVRLHAALKKDGGIQPIAVGVFMRRLIGKCLMIQLGDRARHILKPYQQGVGVKGGAENVIHAVKRLAKEHPELLHVQIDFVNAFGLANREIALQEVQRLFPEIYKWVFATYGCESVLIGNHSLESCDGFQQGDPLAPLLFSLTLNRLVREIAEKVPGLSMNTWYLDDGVLVGTAEQLTQAVQIIVDMGPQLGLHMS